MSREKRKEQAEDTIQLANNLAKERITTYYTADELETKRTKLPLSEGRETRVEVVQKDVVQVIQQTKGKVAVLNFASAKNPGGGFLKGSSAQEESIARASDLYLYLKGQDAFYQNPKHHLNGLYDSDALYATDVTLLKDGNGNRIADKSFDVITSCAVNVQTIKDKKQTDILKLADKTMRARIENVFTLAIEAKVDTLVLGAFGCGVFGNNPYTVRNTFQSVQQDVRFKGKIPKLIYAIYKDESLYRLFLPLQTK